MFYENLPIIFLISMVSLTVTLFYVRQIKNYENRFFESHKHFFGAPPGPDISKGDLVVSELPPNEGWHPILSYLPVQSLYSLAELNGQIGLVIEKNNPIKLRPHNFFKNLPNQINTVDIISQKGKIYKQVPVLTLQVVARKKKEVPGK